MQNAEKFCIYAKKIVSLHTFYVRMENYVALITIVAIGCGIIDLLTDKWPAMQRQLFPILLGVLYFLLIIPYYYGPDIWTYVPHYEIMTCPDYTWQLGMDNQFELGYSLFCCYANEIGLSYWGMTCVIKTIYFLSICLLLRQLPKRKIFAVACIVMMDSNMILHETRQCLAVSFFIFMILLMQNKRYFLACLCAVLTVFMHKSGFVPVALTLAGSVLYQTRQYARVYSFLIIGLMIWMILPIRQLSMMLLEALPALPDTYMESAEHHFLLGRQFQVIAIVYLAVLLAFNIYISYDRKSRYSWIALAVLAGMAIVVVFYPYYFLLSRLRSYFLPFVVGYIVILLNEPQRSQTVPHIAFIKQALMVLVLAFYMHYAISLELGSRSLHSPVFRASTVFDLRHLSPKQVRDRQMKIAENYWIQDYMQSENNKL